MFTGSPHLLLHLYSHSRAIVNIDDVYGARQRNPAQTPLWLVGIYVVSNLFLNSLNLYWFSKMIDSVRRRAEIKKESGDEDHND
jgi:hypothetical protein